MGNSTISSPEQPLNASVPNEYSESFENSILFSPVQPLKAFSPIVYSEPSENFIVSIPVQPLKAPSSLILSVFTAEKLGKPRKYAIFLPFYRIYYSTIFCHRFCHGTYKRDSRLAIYHRKTGRKLKNSMTFSYIFEDNKKTVPLYTAFCLRNTQHQKGSPLWKSLFVLGKVFFVACQSN